MSRLSADEFRNHLNYYLIIRFFFIFTVIFSFFLFPFIRENNDIFSFANKLFLLSAFIMLVFNIVSLIFSRFINEKHLTLFAYLQFIVEISFWVMVSYVSGGISSPYLYVIIINIIYAGILMREKGAIITTLYAFFMLLLQGVCVKFSFLPLITSDLVKTYSASWESYFSRLFTYLLFFSFTGFVASRITKSFRQANSSLIESTRRNKEMQKHFFAIFSQINIGIVIFDETTKFYVNRYAEQFAEILDKFLAEATKDPSSNGAWSEKKIDGIWLSYTVMPYIENQKVIIFSDLTAIRKQEESFELQEKLATIGKLTATIAHEIKNPLTSLIGASELMFSEIKESQPESETEELIEIVRREGTRVKTLLDSLFRYTEETSYTLMECVPSSILSDVVTLFKLGHPKVKITCKVDEFSVIGDAEKLKQVFWNIMTNSAEEMNDEGEINIFSELSENSFKLYFDDTGPGFIEKNIDKIFDPFFSTKKRGTGLGLALVYRIVTKHGGTIKATNTEKGARIIIDFKTKAR